MKTPKTIITKPWAENGDKVPINSEVTPNAFCWDLGAGPNFQLPLDTGGIAIPREGFNGIFNVLSETLKYIQYGNRPPFDPRIAEDTGYDLGAVIRYYPDPNNPQFSYELISMKANNKDNPITTPGFIGSSWMPNNSGICETVQNSNGIGFKWSNGFAVCINHGVGMTRQEAGYSIGTWTFPITFNGYPVSFAQPQQGVGNFASNIINCFGTSSPNTSIGIRSYNRSGADEYCTLVRCFAVGIWRSL